MHAKFKCEAVGQGLFYTGFIDNSVIVYDCGSDNKERLNECIDNFVNELKHKSIDLLVISHFHEDHINGIKKLLSMVTADTVVLPYISDIEKIFLIAKGGYGESLATLSILIDPVKFFLSSGRAENLIFISTDKGNIDYRFEPIRNEDNDKVFDFSAMEVDQNLTEILITHPDYKKLNKKDNNEKLLVLKYNKPAILNKVWELRFFNLEVKSNELKRFEKEIKSYIDFSDKKKLIQQLKDVDIKRKIVECYSRCLNKKGKKFNDTSLVMYHSPIIATDFYLISYIDGDSTVVSNKKNIFFPSYWGRSDSHSASGQMLCGDICLNKKNYSEWKNHYSAVLKNTSLILLPHHGSIHNWNSQIINDCPSSELFFASAGFSNYYGHPSIKVVNELETAGKQFVNGSELVEMLICIHPR